jgi:hypothetical protein
VVVLKRQFVSFLQLAENLRFAEDHRVQPAGHFEEMFDAVRFGQLVNLIRQRIPVIMHVPKKLDQIREDLFRIVSRRDIKLDPIAGGKEHGFLDQAGLTQLRQRRRHTRFTQGEPFPERDRRGVMTEAEGDDHAMSRGQ